MLEAFRAITLNVFLFRAQNSYLAVFLSVSKAKEALI